MRLFLLGKTYSNFMSIFCIIKYVKLNIKVWLKNTIHLVIANNLSHLLPIYSYIGIYYVNKDLFLSTSSGIVTFPFKYNFAVLTLLRRY